MNRSTLDYLKLMQHLMSTYGSDGEACNEFAQGVLYGYLLAQMGLGIEEHAEQHFEEGFSL